MLHYRRFGSGKAIILQHGFVSCGDIFGPLSAELSDHFDVIASDLPGLGGSAHITPPDNISGLAETLIGFINDIGINKFSILGHSLGSETALQLAIDFPERVENLILYGGCAGDLPERFESYQDSIRRIDEEGILHTAARIAATWTRAGKNHPLYEMMRACGVASSHVGSQKLIKAMSKFDVRHRLKEVKARTLVICGDEDKTTHPRHSIELWENIPRAQLCILPNSAHAAHVEVPSVFNQIITRFLLGG